MNYQLKTSDVIASGALLLTCYNLWATRRHNKLSVTPFLSDHTNKRTTDEGLIFSYEITNTGIGPAKIKKFVFLRNGKEFPKPKDKFTQYTDAVIHEHLGNQLDYKITHSSMFGLDTCLKLGDTRKIVEILFPKVNQSNQSDALAKIQGLDLVIQYESFYGQKFVFDTRVGRELYLKSDFYKL